MGKSLLESKEFWVQVITAALVVLTSSQLGAVVPVSALPLIALGDVVLTTILRTFFTSLPISSIFPR